MASRNFGRFALALVLAASCGILSAHAGWSTGAHTGIPTFMNSDGVSNTQTVTTASGPALAIRSGVIGVVVVNIPVTAPAGSAFSHIALKALDNTKQGFVKATLYRRSQNGADELLGSVTSSEGTGMRSTSASLFKSVDSLADGDQLYIRLELGRGDKSAVVMARDIQLVESQEALQSAE